MGADFYRPMDGYCSSVFVQWSTFLRRRLRYNSQIEIVGGGPDLQLVIEEFYAAAGESSETAAVVFVSETVVESSVDDLFSTPRHGCREG